jgi:hypothetical protein
MDSRESSGETAAPFLKLEILSKRDGFVSG